MNIDNMTHKELANFLYDVAKRHVRDRFPKIKELNSQLTLYRKLYDIETNFPAYYEILNMDTTFIDADSSMNQIPSILAFHGIPYPANIEVAFSLYMKVTYTKTKKREAIISFIERHRTMIKTKLYNQISHEIQLSRDVMGMVCEYI